jgi:hypothetical protein
MAEIVVQSQGDGGSKDPVDEGQATDLEGNKGEGSEEEIAAAAEAAEAAKKAEDAAAAAGTPTIEEQLALRDSENQELRSLLRDGKRDMDALTERMSVSEAALEKAGLVSEEEKQAAADQQASFKEREATLETILEVTRLNPKYEDVDTVVEQGNFDATIELMANDYSGKHGVPRGEAVEAVESWVWSLTNPYRFMYGKIKEIHPSYKKAEVGKEKGKELSAESPGSVQGVHGGTSSGDLTGWTAAKIDGLAEDKLGTVPKDVYAKYLRNELK